MSDYNSIFTDPASFYYVEPVGPDYPERRARAEAAWHRATTRAAEASKKQRQAAAEAERAAQAERDAAAQAQAQQEWEHELKMAVRVNYPGSDQSFESVWSKMKDDVIAQALLDLRGSHERAIRTKYGIEL